MTLWCERVHSGSCVRVRRTAATTHNNNTHRHQTHRIFPMNSRLVMRLINDNIFLSLDFTNAFRFAICLPLENYTKIFAITTLQPYSAFGEMQILSSNIARARGHAPLWIWRNVFFLSSCLAKSIAANQADNLWYLIFGIDGKSMCTEINCYAYFESVRASHRNQHPSQQYTTYTDKNRQTIFSISLSTIEESENKMNAIVLNHKLY